MMPDDDPHLESVKGNYDAIPLLWNRPFNRNRNAPKRIPTCVDKAQSIVGIVRSAHLGRLLAHVHGLGTGTVEY